LENYRAIQSHHILFCKRIEEPHGVWTIGFLVNHESNDFTAWDDPCEGFKRTCAHEQSSIDQWNHTVSVLGPEGSIWRKDGVNGWGETPLASLARSVPIEVHSVFDEWEGNNSTCRSLSLSIPVSSDILG
jgi:hypothetical protein